MTALFIIVVVLLAIGLLYWLFMSSYSQIFGAYPWRVKTGERVIALTFDDGPNEPYTSELLQFLNSKGVKATFFQVGKCVERYPATTKKIIKSGHVVGNHSLSHEFHKFFQSLDFDEEIVKNQAIIKKYTGKTPALFRPPWLLRQPLVLRRIHHYGLQPVSGEFCHSLEVLRIDPKKIAKAAIKKAKPGAIIIFHDGIDGKGGDRQQTIDAAKIVVNQLIKDGYSFVTVDKLLGVPAYQK